MKLREALLKFEDNPKLLNIGYKPFVPSIESVDEDNYVDNGVECSLDSIEHNNVIDMDKSEICNENGVQFKPTVIEDCVDCQSKSNDNELLNASFDVSRKGDKKAENILAYNNPTIVHALSILDRYLSKDDNVKSTNGLTSHLESKLQTHCQPTEKADKVSNIEQYFPPVKTSSYTPTANSTVKKSRNLLKTLKLSTSKVRPVNSAIEFETVEFTPGMTSKVRK